MAHSLKGSLGALCAYEAHDAARQVEELGRDLEQARTRYAELDEAIKRLLPALHTQVIARQREELESAKQREPTTVE